MTTLSLIVITYNEAHNLDQCLSSVPFADEIIVLDSGSTDNTVEIAKQYTPHVYVTDWPGYGPQKNRALDKAQCDWVLCLDADERLSSQAQSAIQKAIQSTRYVGYSLPFQSAYCGRIMRYGDWRGDRDICLFRKNSGRYTDSPVHEKLMIEGQIGQLNAPIYHESFTHLNQVIDKMNHYSTLAAERKAQEGKQGSLKKALLHSLWRFFRGYILRAGFLDGREGFMLAVSNAEGTYYQYLKLAEKQTISPQAHKPHEDHHPPKA